MKHKLKRIHKGNNYCPWIFCYDKNKITKPVYESILRKALLLSKLPKNKSYHKTIDFKEDKKLGNYLINTVEIE